MGILWMIGIHQLVYKDVTKVRHVLLHFSRFKTFLFFGHSKVLSDTHHRCKELLEQNGFSVSQSLVLCLGNAFDITIRQTIKRYYRLQQIDLHFLLQMQLCITHHIRAQYIDTNLQCTEMKYSICSDAK